MQFDNYRDPNAESIWLKKSNDYNVQVPEDSCYSNLSHYGTGFGTNNFNIYHQQHADPNLGGGLVHKIQAPYPVEDYPEIMQKLGTPHTYNSHYDGKKAIFNCNGYITNTQYCHETHRNSRKTKPLDRGVDTMTSVAPLNSTLSLGSSHWEQKASELLHDFEKGLVTLYNDAKNVYNWIKKYVCPNISVSVLTDLTKSVEAVLQSSSSTGMKIAHVAELFFRKCVL